MINGFYMAYEFKKHKMIDGRRYGPTEQGWYYQPADYHGKVIFAFSIPKGSVMEFFDKVLLLKDSYSYIIEDEPVIRTRSFMSSIRYQDILSETKEKMITLHALDTLNVSRNEISGKVRKNGTLADVYETIGLNMPAVDIDYDSELPF